MIRHIVSGAAATVALSATAAASAQAQKVHEIRLEADAARDVYRFSPARTTVRRGDVLLFTVTGGGPHSVVFEGRGLSRQAHDALNAALPRRTGDLSSPMLTEAGAEYRVVVPALPSRSYAFYCLPHRAYDMRGEIVVK
jgi:plastocyanin